MSELFTPLSAPERAEFRACYLSYLKARDGVPDPKTNRFSVREAFFQDIERNPVRWAGTPPVDQGVFDRHHERYDAREQLDEATLWALCVAKTNRSERYGVEYSQKVRPIGAESLEDPRAYIEVEEFYHTRILCDALEVIGLKMEMRDPSLGQRLLIKSMVHMPAAVSDVLVFCGEIFGVAIFNLLLGKARELFASQPQALARIEALFAQIMVDEVGHVHFVRSKLGQGQLALARRLLPHVARGIGDGMPELWVLFGRERVLAAVQSADVDAAARPYSDRFDWRAALAA